ncbi:retropepsin-like aspartic protease [Flavobacterium sp.]|uniref:retropepsin-like aspartic protease n=1 Tax=Flavobacterium sp. TaxID=239 RepID=UPI003D291A9E
MEDLQDFLKGKKYKKIKFKVLKTQHLMIKAKINAFSGNFILDTGASNSCVGIEGIEKFQLFAEYSETKAAGAGATGMETQISKNNNLQLSRWKSSKLSLIVFDMSHVNEALKSYKTKPVDGIIGADILLKGKAIIDYYNHYLYLK